MIGLVYGMRDFFDLQEKLKDVLQPKRYEHTLGVRYTAASLAMCHGVDVDKAQLAGILHDCAKSYSDEELLSMAEEYQLSISDVERISPYLLHAKVGAYLAEHIYGVKDEEVLEAIRYHTTGKPEMTALEKIVFIADYIEPNRKMIKGLPESRKLAYKDLDEAMYYILENTLNYLKEKSVNTTIDATTKSAYEFYAYKKKENMRKGE